MDRGAWWDVVHGVAESGTTKAAEHTCMQLDTKNERQALEEGQ